MDDYVDGVIVMLFIAIIFFTLGLLYAYIVGIEPRDSYMKSQGYMWNYTIQAYVPRDYKLKKPQLKLNGE